MDGVKKVISPIAICREILHQAKKMGLKSEIKYALGGIKQFHVRYALRCHDDVGEVLVYKKIDFCNEFREFYVAFFDGEKKEINIIDAPPELNDKLFFDLSNNVIVPWLKAIKENNESRSKNP